MIPPVRVRFDGDQSAYLQHIKTAKTLLKTLKDYSGGLAQNWLRKNINGVDFKVGFLKGQDFIYINTLSEVAKEELIVEGLLTDAVSYEHPYGWGAPFPGTYPPLGTPASSTATKTAVQLIPSNSKVPNSLMKVYKRGINPVSVPNPIFTKISNNKYYISGFNTPIYNSGYSHIKDGQGPQTGFVPNITQYSTRIYVYGRKTYVLYPKPVLATKLVNKQVNGKSEKRLYVINDSGTISYTKDMVNFISIGTIPSTAFSYSETVYSIPVFNNDCTELSFISSPIEGEPPYDTGFGRKYRVMRGYTDRFMFQVSLSDSGISYVKTQVSSAYEQLWTASVASPIAEATYYDANNNIFIFSANSYYNTPSNAINFPTHKFQPSSSYWWPIYIDPKNELMIYLTDISGVSIINIWYKGAIVYSNTTIIDSPRSWANFSSLINNGNGSVVSLYDQRLGYTVTSGKVHAYPLHPPANDKRYFASFNWISNGDLSTILGLTAGAPSDSVIWTPTLNIV